MNRQASDNFRAGSLTAGAIGHYAFQSSSESIDRDTLIAGLKLG